MNTSPAQRPASLVLAGNALSVLIAATERAHRGLATTIINPGGPLGGYFSGVHALGRRVDGGMVLFEFSSFSEPAVAPRLDSYDPMKRNDVGRFCGVIRRYVQGLHSTHAVGTPRMWVDGKLLPDMMLGNGISALHHLSNSAAIHRELAVIDRQVKHDTVLWHPANKTTWPLDGSAPADWASTQGNVPFDCDSLSRRIHGQTLHETLFVPFAHQVMNRDASHLAALYHRLPWLPMYWPQTLLSTLSNHGRVPGMPATVFNYPSHGSIAAICQNLAQMVRNHPLITLVEDPIQQVRRTADHFIITTAKHGDIHAQRLGWAMTPNRGMAVAGMTAPAENPERLPLMLGFFKLAESQVHQVVSVLHAVANDTGIYRITNATACGTPTDEGTMRLVVEANPHRFAAHHVGINLNDESAVMQAMLRDLSVIGVTTSAIRPIGFELKRFDGALPLPTPAAVETFLEAREQMLRALPGIEPMGASAGPFAFGLSDQIIQGLQMAHRVDRKDDVRAEAIEPALAF